MITNYHQAVKQLRLLKASEIFQPEIVTALNYSIHALSKTKFPFEKIDFAAPMEAHLCLKSPLSQYNKSIRENISYLRILIDCSSPMSFEFRKSLIIAHHVLFEESMERNKR